MRKQAELLPRREQRGAIMGNAPKLYDKKCIFLVLGHGETSIVAELTPHPHKWGWKSTQKLIVITM